MRFRRTTYVNTCTATRTRTCITDKTCTFKTHNIFHKILTICSLHRFHMNWIFSKLSINFFSEKKKIHCIYRKETKLKIYMYILLRREIFIHFYWGFWLWVLVLDTHIYSMCAFSNKSAVRKKLNDGDDNMREILRIRFYMYMRMVIWPCDTGWVNAQLIR